MNIKLFIQSVVEFFGNKVHEKPPKRIFDPSSDLYSDLEKGDVVLVRTSDAFYSGVISEFTKSPYSHSQIHIKDGYAISAEPNGVGFVDMLEDNFKGNKDVDVFRFKGGLSRDQRLIIESKAYKTILMPYDYEHLVRFPFLSKKAIAKYAGNKAFICSEHVAWCYDNAGIDLVEGRPETIEAPGDIGRSDKLEYVGTYVEGKKVDNFSNKFMDRETSFIAKLATKLLELFTKDSAYAEGLKVNKTKMLKEE